MVLPTDRPARVQILKSGRGFMMIVSSVIVVIQEAVCHDEGREMRSE
jgi:hypothetical protein